MNRRRIAFLAPLFAVLAMLCALTETASAAFNPSAQNPHYGNFLLRESEASASEWLQLADPTKENGEWIYDSTLGVPVYVRQNPWSKFDPLGLAVDSEGVNYSGEGHHKLPKETVTEMGFTKETKQLVFDKNVMDAPGHRWSQAHNAYSFEVSAEIHKYSVSQLGENYPKEIASMSAKAQVDYAKNLVKHIDTVDNQIIKGFNTHAALGQTQVDKWFLTEGSSLSLKSLNGANALKGGKIMMGTPRLMRLAKRLGPVVGLAMATNTYAQHSENYNTAEASWYTFVDTFDPTFLGVEGAKATGTKIAEKTSPQLTPEVQIEISPGLRISRPDNEDTFLRSLERGHMYDSKIPGVKK